MDQQTALILIVVNLSAAVVIIIWYLFDRYTKRIESLIRQNNKPSCAFIQAKPNVKDKNMWLYPFLVGAIVGVCASALLFLHTVGWF
jgi:hypothetical protein